MNSLRLPSEVHPVNKTPSTFWSTSQIRITGIGPEGAVNIEIDQPCAMIGTHERSDLVLKGNRVARRHLYLHATDDGIYCINLAKAHRDKTLTGKWIRNKQTVQVGPYKLQFGFVSGKELKVDEQPVDLLARKSVERPFPLMLCWADESPLGNRFLSRRLSLVGRDPFCSFQFITRTMSPEHSIIYQQAGQIWIVDLKSTSKTLLNGQAINVARLVDNSVITMGRVSISIQRTAQPGQGPRRKSETELPADSPGDLVQPNEQMQTAETIPSEHRVDSAHSSDILDNDDNLNLFPADDDLVSGGSDLDLRCDESETGAEEYVTIDEKSQSLDELSKSLTLRENDLEVAEAQQEEQLSAFLHQKSELDKRLSEMQTERERFESQLQESTSRANQRSTELDIREEQLVLREKGVDEARDTLRNDENQWNLKNESEKKQLLAQIAELQVALEKSGQESLRQIVSLNELLVTKQQNDAEIRKEHEQNTAELLRRQTEFEAQRKSWQDEKRQQEIEQQAAAGQLRQELEQMAKLRLDIEKEQDVVRQQIAEAEARATELAELELQRKQLEEDRTRWQVQHEQFKEEQKQWREVQEQIEADAGENLQKMREEITTVQESLAAEQQAHEQVQFDFQQRQQSWLAEQERMKEQLKLESDQLQERETRLASEASEFESRQQAWLEDSSILPTENNSGEVLQTLRQELDSERSRLAEQKSEWELERERQAEESAANAAELQEQKAELVAAQERLQTDLREFDRYVTIGQTQHQVLDNLKKMKREKKSSSRFWSWLFGRKG